MNKKHLLLAAIAFQILAVAAISISKEWVLATGEEVILQTAPIDPRDIFRGDYVRLDYAFSQIATSRLDSDIVDNGLKKGEKAYLSLTKNNAGIAQADRLFNTEPSDQLYLTGRVTSHWPNQWYFKRAKPNKNPDARRHPVKLKYGIERFYVEQGKGLEMEKIRGSRDSFQVPMLMHVAVSGSGQGVIRSFEWANIAMKTELVKSPERDAEDDQASAIMRFTIKNRGQQEIRMPWKPNGCSFSLIPVTTSPLDSDSSPFKYVLCNVVKTENKTLSPDQEVSIEFDLNQPHWRLEYKGKSTPLGKLPWNYRFRIKYNEVNANDINAQIVSRAFHGRGNID